MMKVGCGGKSGPLGSWIVFGRSAATRRAVRLDADRLTRNVGVSPVPSASHRSLILRTTVLLSLSSVRGTSWTMAAET